MPFQLRQTGPTFDIETEADTFDQWKVQWEAFTYTSGLRNIDDNAERRRYTLMALMVALSRETIRTVQNLNVDDETRPDNIIKALEVHIKGSINEIVYRRKFYQRHRQEGESFNHWLIELRDIARKCNFARCCNNCETLQLRDMIVVGIQNEDTQQELLEKGSELTLDDAIKLCESMEMARKDKATISDAGVNAIKNQSSYKRDKVKTTGSNTPKGAGSRMPACCPWCGGKTSHQKKRDSCPAKGKDCSKCGKSGHFAKVCRSSGNPSNGKETARTTVNAITAQPERPATITAIEIPEVDEPTPLVTVTMNGVCLSARPDSAANIDAVGPHIMKKLGLRKKDLQPVPDVTTAANKSGFTNVGKFAATIQMGDETVKTNIRVLEELQDQTPILKKSTCQALRILPREFPKQLLPQPQVANTQAGNATKESLMEEFHMVFDGVIRPMEGEKFKVSLEPGAKPFSVTTPRRIPLPLMDKLEKELKDLQDQGIIRPVTKPTAWCAPIVVAPKKDPNKIRLCVDFRGLNKFVQRERYQSPTAHEAVMKASLHKAELFTIVDALKGYHQIPLEEDSQELTTFITPFGRFCYLMSPFGISSISEHYNRRMDEALAGLERTEHIVDDCLVASKADEHEADVRRFLQRCQERGIALNRDKFVYASTEVTFAGLRLSRKGFSIDPGLLQAVREFPTPTDKTDVRSFFGLINQLGSFTDKIAELSQPLKPLLKGEYEFAWNEAHQEAFDQVRQELTKSDAVIAYYDPKKPTSLHTDASRLKGLGFVLKQQQPDGTWRMVQAGSRFLSDAETRYAMIELELLGVCWAAAKCRIFLEGLPRFEIVVDHRPLVPILNSYSLDQIENPRLQRLRMKLDRYNYEARWIPGKEHYAADALSRAPHRQAQPEDQIAEPDDHSSGMINAIRDTQLDPRLREVQEAAANDSEYTALKKVILNGFPNEKANLPMEIRPFWHVRGKLAVDDDFIVCGRRTVIPKQLRQTILERLKNGHMGSSKTKERARQIVWWPNIDNDIEQAVKRCKICQDHLPRNQQEPLRKRPDPTRAFQELHLDFGEHAGHKFLVAVDGYSGFPVVLHCGKHALTSQLINGLRTIFIQTAVPEKIWSDGGPQFKAHGFKAFLERWRVDHITSSPEYPQSNGRAEAGIKNIKKMIRGSFKQGRIDNDLFLEALLLYRNTPMHDGRVPSVMVYGKPLRDTLPPHRRNFAPDWQKTVQDMEETAVKKHDKIRESYDSRAKPLKSFRSGTRVAIFDTANKAWNRYGIVVETMKNREYLVKTSSGRILRRNRRLLRERDPVSLPGDRVQAPARLIQVPATPPPPPPMATTRSLRPRGTLRAPRRLIQEI